MQQSIVSQFLTENLDLRAATGQDDAVWEQFQLAYMNDESKFRIEVKARQIAWSWITAAVAVAKAVLGIRDTIFVSINQDEAQEKIRYALQVYESLRVDGYKLPEIKNESKAALEFTNKKRLRSFPSKAPRGPSNTDIILDEFAHVRYDQSIYSNAMAATTKGGIIRIGSSPFGESGMFWEVYTAKDNRYRNFNRKSTPWWETFALCSDPLEAYRLHKVLTTEELVRRFAKETIVQFFDNMPLEDFEQEFCALFQDSQSSWITWDDMEKVVSPNLECLFVQAKDKEVYKAKEGIDALAEMIRLGMVQPNLAVGVDVGRTRDLTEIYFVEAAGENTYPLRAAISIAGMEFDDQQEILVYALKVLPIASMLIDKNGIGMQLAENVSKTHVSASGVTFSNESKKLWATMVKTLCQQGRCPIPVNKDLSYQIHSIKRMVTASKNLVFDTAKNEKHHADKFWAWALALAGFNDASNVVVDPIVTAQSFQGRDRYGETDSGILVPSRMGVDDLKKYYEGG